MKVLPILVFLVLSGCRLLLTHTPKYQPGDCVVWKFDSKPESWEHRSRYLFSRRIVEVGHTNYRTLYWHGTESDGLAKDKAETTDTIRSIDWYFVQVDCKTLDPVK